MEITAIVLITAEIAAASIWLWAAVFKREEIIAFEDRCIRAAARHLRKYVKAIRYIKRQRRSERIRKALTEGKTVVIIRPE